jgi:hypothetical protein
VTARQRAWTVPADGISDPIDVELAARGIRQVPLTRAQRQAAAATLLARGGGLNMVCVPLRVSGSTASKLAARWRHAVAS